jgi:hypothetical protein
LSGVNKGCENNRTVISTAGEYGLRAALAGDPAAVVLLIGIVEHKICGFFGKEAYTLDVNGNAVFMESLTKALEALTASIAVEEDEFTNSDDVAKLWEIEETPPRPKPALSARAQRFLRQAIAAWNKPHAFGDAARHEARLFVGVRTIRDGRMEVIFEHGVLFGTNERPERFDVSTKMCIRDALQKAVEVAEIKAQQLAWSRR